MIEELKQAVSAFFAEHCAGKTGLFIGMLIGIAILVFGFWKTFFVLLCGCIGCYVGTRMEREEDWLPKVLSSLQNRLPDRFQNWL